MLHSPMLEVAGASGDRTIAWSAWRLASCKQPPRPSVRPSGRGKQQPRTRPIWAEGRTLIAAFGLT
jgi:hypothetical protein